MPVLPDIVSAVLEWKLLVPAVSLAVFWAWETWRPFFGVRKGRLRHAGRNLALALLNTLVLTLGLGLLTALVTAWASTRELGLLRHVGLAPGAVAVAAIVSLDAVMYLWHRANHVIPLLWRFHRVHHTDDRMDVTTATRFHIGEHLGAFLLRVALIPLFGFELGHLLVYNLLLLVMTQFHHADISLGRFDRWLRFVVVTPDMHKVHHSRVRRETDSNYSVVFSVWDRIGRSHVEADPGGIVFGLFNYDADRWQSLVGMLETPFVAPLEPNPDDQQGA